MDEHESLRRLVRSEEGQYFERKSLFDGIPGTKQPRGRKDVRRQIAEYVAAFANADGGTLVLGVENDGSVTGHAYPPETVEQMLRVPEVQLRPPLAAGRTVVLDGRELLLFEVVAAARAVMVVGDGFPRREGDEVIQSSDEEINRTKDAGARREPRGSSIRRNARRSRLGARASRDGRGRVRGRPRVLPLHRRLADRRGETLALRNGAVWLFAREASTIAHPNIGVRVFRVHGTDQQSGAARNVQDYPWIEGNLVWILERATELIGSLIRSSTKLHDLFFREVPEYPPLAWQEALVNALAHRDYGIEGRCTEVHLYEDRMEVVSPGGLFSGITLEALLERRRVHASRNPRIARVLTELGIMRQQGEGIPRMIEEMEMSWLPAPELRADESLFSVTLRNQPIFQGADERWTAFVRDLPIDVRQKRALVAFHDREFASGDYQALNRINRDLAYRELQQLEDGGLIDAQGATRGRRYRVNKSAVVTEAAAPTPIQRLVARMAEAGRLTNSDYRDIFGVDRPEATRALAAMVGTGVLRLAGERRGAHYVPGEAWPPRE